jgi:hypothetical protein
MARVSFRQRSHTKVAPHVYANWSFKKGLRSFTIRPFSWLGWNTASHETSINTPGPGGLRVQPGGGDRKQIGLAIAAAVGTGLFRLIAALFRKPKRRGRRR